MSFILFSRINIKNTNWVVLVISLEVLWRQSSRGWKWAAYLLELKRTVPPRNKSLSKGRERYSRESIGGLRQVGGCT